MLPPRIIEIWKEQIFAVKNIDIDSSTESEKAMSLFRRLISISADEARKVLAETNPDYNRDLAWFILESAIKKQGVNNIQYLLRLVEWAEFIAEFGNPTEYRKDSLEAHCEFYMGILYHMGENPEKARESYLKSETYYRDADSNKLYLALVIFAEGYLSLELQNIGEGKTNGARNKFKEASEILEDESINFEMSNDIKSNIERGLRQFELVDSLLEGNNPDSIISSHKNFIDPQLCSILKGRMYSLAFGEYPVSEAYKAAAFLDKILKLFDIAAESFETLKDIYASSNKLSNAEWIVREQLKGSSVDSLELQKELAGFLFLQAKYTEAQQLFEKILKDDPHDVFIRNRLADLLLSLGDPTSASIHYRSVLAEQPDEKHATQMLKQIASQTITWAGSYLDDEGKMFLREEDCQKYGADVVFSIAFLIKYPEQTEDYLDSLKSNKDLFEKVRSLLVAMGKISPSLEPAQEHFSKAEELFKQARFQDAAKEYNLAIEADPNYTEAYIYLGDCYYRTGEYNMAISYFEESLKIEPNKFAYRFLGDCYKNLGKYKDAVESYKQALKIDPDYTGAADSLDILLNEIG